MSEISCIRVVSYEDELLYEAVKQQFELLAVKDELKPGMKVLLKPNLLMKRRPEEFTTTHPSVAGAVARVLQEYGITDLVLADSPGEPYAGPLLSGIYNAAGFTAASEAFGFSLNNDTGYREKVRMENTLCKQFYLINPVLEADYIIDLCKLKTHGMVGLSGAVKNMFGCIPGLMKPELHFRFPEEERFCEMLVDLCETVRPNLIVVDAVDSMQGDGPSGGTLLHTGMLLAGKNPYDIDLMLCNIIGFEPEKIHTVRIARNRGLSAGSADELTVLGDTPALFPDFVKPTSHDVNFSNSMPKWIPKRILNHFASKPKIIQKGCIGCGKCAESCPAKTIELKARKATIHYDNCIRCFCCHEMCPVKTIEIKRSRFYRF